ncbi:MerR family transcriptional regulator [Pseudomonas sp. M47T1]|uniref:MerR family transcriptional regulator n=1 Tax=unclassified Pseudomonas TaxID=196821 RepID=UPI0002607223|nr:MerR family transcriptional regulator [Pseudomonas sp. M47T1]EIK97036.1 MerR family transcriptional regulator [Pseudomonas sp. M47T1]
MKIGQLAKAAGVSCDALRFYEERGLIRATRSANGYRHYPAQTVQLVLYIRTAQQLGFSLAEVGENLPALWQASDEPVERLAVVFAQKLAAIDERIAQLQRLRQALSERAQAVCPLAPMLDGGTGGR